MGNFLDGKFVAYGCNHHKGGEFLCTFSPEFDPINAGHGTYWNSVYAFCKNVTQGKECQDFSVTLLSIMHKDMWQSVGNAPCTFKFTNRCR